MPPSSSKKFIGILAISVIVLAAVFIYFSKNKTGLIPGNNTTPSSSGELSASEREAVVKQFSENPSPEVAPLTETERKQVVNNISASQSTNSEQQLTAEERAQVLKLLGN